MLFRNYFASCVHLLLLQNILLTQNKFFNQSTAAVHFSKINSICFNNSISKDGDVCLSEDLPSLEPATPRGHQGQHPEESIVKNIKKARLSRQAGNLRCAKIYGQK